MSRAALRERLYSNLKRKKAMAEPFIGQILLVPYNFAPRNWAFCQGQLLQIGQYTALFSLIGNTFGGDGDKTFALYATTGFSDSTAPTPSSPIHPLVEANKCSRWYINSILATYKQPPWNGSRQLTASRCCRIRARSSSPQVITTLPRTSGNRSCGKETIVIGYETSEQLDVEPAKYFVRVIKREKRACKTREERGVQCAALPARIIDKSLAGDRLLLTGLGALNKGRERRTWD